MRWLLPLRAFALSLLLLGPGALWAQAFEFPAVGSAETFDVATWNIEHFGSTTAGPTDVERQFQNVLAVMQQAEIDLWALQELNDAATFERLLDELGEEWAGTRTTGTGTFGYGYVYRRDRVEVLRATTILNDFSFEFAQRPPLMLTADVTLPNGSLRNVRIINLHAKALADFQSYERRRDGSVALKNYVDNLLAINAPVLVLGDLNDELRVSTSSSRPSPYANFRDDEENYFFGTLALEDAGVNTYCFNVSCTSGSTIDHILVTRPLFDAYVENSTARLDALLENVPNYRNTTSDHVAVHAQLAYFTTSTDPGSATPQAFRLEPPFPNPFGAQTTVTFTLPETAQVRLEVYDALGRRVAVLADGPRGAGSHDVTFSGGSLPPGLYLVRLTASGASGEHTATRRVVRVQ